MKLSHFLFLLLAFCTTACQSQSAFLEVVNPTKGNTGHRGILPRDENGQPIEMPKGKDYFQLDLKAKRNCTVKIVHMTVKTSPNAQCVLNPTFEKNETLHVFKKNDIFSLRVEKEENVPNAKSIMINEGKLTVKVNGKLVNLLIKEFTLILPQ